MTPPRSFGVEPLSVICTSDFSIAANYDAHHHARRPSPMSGLAKLRRRAGVPAPVRRLLRPSRGCSRHRARAIPWPRAVTRCAIQLPRSGELPGALGVVVPDPPAMYNPGISREV
jgi:hypothetical protein